MSASLAPAAASARTAVTIGLRLSDDADEGAVPPPLRSAAIELPAGLGIDLSATSTCAPAVLRRHGAGGCPGASRIGSGHATLAVHAGSQTIPEPATLTVFRGPAQGAEQTVELLGVGHSPLQERTISSGVLTVARPPYGLRLALTIPPVPTLALEPDASFTAIALTVGAGVRLALHAPVRCPAGGYPFAAQLRFAGGAQVSTRTTQPCG